MSLNFNETVFEKFDEIGDFSENLENADTEEVEKLDYIWVAEKTDGTILPQFEPDGTERNYSEVRELDEDSKIEAIYWTPVDQHTYDSPTSKDIVGATGLTDKYFRIFRRGAKKWTMGSFQTKDTKAYAIEVEGVFCFLSHRGETFVNGDGNFHPEADA